LNSAVRSIILKLSPEGVYYNPSDCIPWEKTNFPPVSSFGILDTTEVYWVFEQLSFDKKTNELEVSPIDYKPSSREPFNIQHPKFPIKALAFRAIDWVKLRKVLYKYSPNDFAEITYTSQHVDDAPRFGGMEKYSGKVPDKRAGSHEVDFSISLKKVTFKYGYVAFEKPLPDLKLREDMRIENSYILPEFDFIKPYFFKVFGKKTIQVRGRIHISDGGETTHQLTSPEIGMIDEQFLAGIKKIMIEDAVKKPQIITVDKGLFTEDDFLEGLHEEKLGDTLSPSEQDILNTLLDAKGVRNRKQLEYLAGKIQTPSEKIRFTLNPNFGFLFFHQGERNTHYIWELINSHATYVWTFPGSKPMSGHLKKVEEIINFIRINGRTAYVDNVDEIFHKVIHRGGQLKDAFPRWRHELNALLT